MKDRLGELTRKQKQRWCFLRSLLPSLCHTGSTERRDWNTDVRDANLLGDPEAENGKIKVLSMN
jgi:hypothetical protein